MRSPPRTPIASTLTSSRYALAVAPSNPTRHDPQLSAASNLPIPTIETATESIGVGIGLIRGFRSLHEIARTEPTMEISATRSTRASGCADLLGHSMSTGDEANEKSAIELIQYHMPKQARA